MLGYLRERSGSWIIKIILGLIIIIFAFFFGVGGFGPKGRGPVAMVNDQPITFEEYKESYESIVSQIRTRMGDTYDEKILKQLNVKKTALDRLIEEKLVSSVADKLEVKVLNQELAESVNNSSFFQTDGNFDFEKYKSLLARNSMTPESFEYSQKGLLTQQKMRNLLFDTVIVSEIEALDWQKYSNTKVSINYLKIDPAQISNIQPSEDELNSYYNENKNDYKTDEKLRVEYLRFSPEDYKEKAIVDDKDIQQYYEENTDQYSVQEQVEARHVLIKTDQNASDDKVAEAKEEALKIYNLALDKKNDFAELAKKFSQGPSKENGGYLGKFSKTDMIEAFSKTAFSMDAGEISMPVKTQFGWHIIKVENKFEPVTKSFEEVKDEIKNSLVEKKIADLAYFDAGDAFDSVFDGDSLEQAGRVTQRQVIKTEAFLNNGIGLNFKNNKKFVEAAFSTIINEISNIVEIGNVYFLIKPVEKIEPEVIEYPIIKDRVRSDLLAKLQYKEAEKSSSEILALAKEKGSLSQTGKDKKIEIKTTESFSRTGYIPEMGYAQEILDAAFKLSTKDEIYPDVLKINDVFYIISLNEKIIPDGFKDSEEKKAIIASLENQKKEKVYAAWINKLKATNEVEILIPEIFE